MRITQQMLNNNMIGHLNKNLSRMQVLQNQLATGKKISKPSDDPVGINYSLRYRSELQANEQYQRNIDSAISYLDYNDTMLSEAVNVAQRARELTVQAANGTNSAESKKAIAAEMDQLFEQLREIANSQFNGKYIFNGQKTSQAPYPSADAYLTANVDSGDISFELAKGVTMVVNQSAEDVFGASGDAGNIFVTLKAISEAVQLGESDEIGSRLAQLDQDIDRLLTQWADVGARKNRVELIENRMLNENINVTSLLSKTEDVDMAEAIMRMKMEENVYMASLSVGARIIQPSLIDFLR